MGEHAALPPSGAAQWGPGGCPASVRMQKQYPQPEDGPEAREGVAAHHYVTEALAGRVHPVGSLAPNGHPIDAEMVRCGRDFLRDVIDTYNARTPGRSTALHIEKRVFMPQVHSDNWGTPDVWFADTERKTLFVWDYKYGHRYVEAFKNWQLIDYAIGALATIGIPMTEWRQWKAVLTVGQPRYYGPVPTMREYHTDGTTLLEFLAELQKAAILAMEPNASFQTGSYCLDCSAAHACEALKRAGANAMDVSMRSNALEMDPGSLGFELRLVTLAAQRLKARKEALEAYALGVIRSGKDVPFFKADYSKGRERWARPVPEILAMGEIMGVDLAKEPEAITPNQARQKGVDATVIKAYAEIPMGAMKIVPVDDTTAAKAFQ